MVRKEKGIRRCGGKGGDVVGGKEKEDGEGRRLRDVSAVTC